MSETPDMALGEQVVATAQALAERGLNRGTAGNVSVRNVSAGNVSAGNVWAGNDWGHSGAGMLITPSGILCEDLDAAQIVSMALDGAWEGTLKPSSEWRMHADIYANYPAAGAVVHTHSDHAAALACLEEPIPAFHYMVAAAGGDHIACAAYATFGSAELSANMLRALGDRRACLLAHHGMICFGPDPAAALRLAEEVEGLARQYSLARSIARPPILPREEMERVLERFRTGYGQSPKSPASRGAD